MLNGLRSAFRRRSSESTDGRPIVKSSAELDRLLPEDATTRKKFLSQFCWFHEKIKTRNAAEIKLKQSVETGKNECIFLIRSSTACSGEFVISFCANGRCQHYNIQFNDAYKYCFENGPQFNGLNDLIRFYQQKKTNELPCHLTKPCPDGQPPPPLSLSTGYTNMLHKAIAAGNSEAAQRIILHTDCPPLDDRNDKGSTALHLACISGLEQVSKLLVQKGATVSAADMNGYSALQLACIHNRVSIARMLIVEGEACPHWRVPATGNVPLHLSAEKGHIETVEMLLRLDVPAHSRNLNQKTPYELAVLNGHNECAALIDYQHNYQQNYNVGQHVPDRLRGPDEAMFTDFSSYLKGGQLPVIPRQLVINNYTPPPALTNRRDWFHEKISREVAAALLDKHLDMNGLFLIRRSGRSATEYVLEICYKQQIKHYIISEFMTVYFIGDGPLLPSLEHLVEYYCVYADGLETTLQYGLSPNGSIVSLTALSEGFHSKLPPEVPGRDRPPVALEPMILDKDTITTTYELGQGEYGSVMKGAWKAPSGELIPVAIKTLNQQHLVSGTEGFLREAQVMVRLDHPCIVKLIGICQGPPLMLVQELLQMGSLLDFLLDYPEKVDIRIDIPLWAIQIAFGMKYIEKQALVHRDLAARNILLASKSQVKICDFGLSRAIGTNSDYYRASQGGRWPVKWYAPESINYGTFSSASDVWGYGVTLWEMYSFGDQPYSDMTGAQVLQYIERKGRLQRPECCPEAMYLMMRRCWSYKVADRPTFKLIYNELQFSKNYENADAVKQTAS